MIAKWGYVSRLGRVVGDTGLEPVTSCMSSKPVGAEGGQRSVTKANSDPLLQPAGWTSAGSDMGDKSARSTTNGQKYDEDATLGRAWRECVAALPPSYMLQVDGAEGWEAVALPFRYEWPTYKGSGDTVTEALNNLRRALAE
jgi:hypothetical protein